LEFRVYAVLGNFTVAAGRLKAGLRTDTSSLEFRVYTVGVNLIAWPARATSGVNSMKSSAKSCLHGENSAAIRGIPRRIGQTSGTCDFSFRRRVLNIIITSATARNVWIIFRVTCWLCLGAHAGETFAWCVLPNHSHALVEAPDIKRLLHELGLLHGRTSHAWNGEEQTRGRKVFFRVVERAMRSDRHYWATLNYIHHNPVRHGYAEHWTDWPWSSATQYLAQRGLDEAKRIWRTYPVSDYGKDWDEPEM
jgi:putative transposase